MAVTTIDDVVQYLCTQEALLAITTPVSSAIKRAYAYSPNRQNALADLPCFVNTWKLNSIEWGLDALGGPRHEFYTINVQLFVDDADINRGSQIATAFLPQIIGILHSSYTFGGLVQQADITGGEPTLALLEWAGQSYPGLNLNIDVEIVNI